MKASKPKIHYPTLKSYIKRFYARDGVIFPCLVCEGRGNYYDPDDPPDVIEGYKMVRRLKCVACKGTGEGDFESVNKEWEQRVKEDKQKVKDFEVREKQWKKLKKKLTEGDLELLYEFEFRGYEE